MIASQRSSHLWLGLACALISALACATATPPPPARMLEPLSRVPARPPRAADRAAADLAAAALVGDTRAASDAFGRIEQALEAHRGSEHRSHRSSGELLEAEGERAALLPLAIDLANAAQGDERRYREATRALLDRRDLNPAHRARLEQALADDPLALARDRLRDDYESLWAQTFNAVSAPLGRALITGFASAPYEIAMSIAHYLAGLAERPAVSTQERQALAHWERFLARHPQADEAPKVRERASRLRERLARAQYDHFVASAELALRHGQPRLAAIQAQRALEYLATHRTRDLTAEQVVQPPEDVAEATQLLAESNAAITRHRELRRASVAWPATAARRSDVELPEPEDSNASLSDLASGRGDLARALLVWDHEALGASLRSALAESEADDPLRDAIEFAMAGVQIESGYEAASWERLDELARRDPERSSMARHAAALIHNPAQHPYRAFRRRRTAGRERSAAAQILGPWSRGPRYRALPSEVAYLLDAPAIAQTALSTPFRLLMSPLRPDSPVDYRRSSALAAYDYLERRPGGEHARELIDWLFEYESERENALAALRLADHLPDFDADDRRELAEQAAEQQLVLAARTRRRDLRSMLLRGVVRSFPDSTAGAEAGILARREATETTPQRIRMTRGFLRENPQIVSPRGLGVAAALLDGDQHNGELHPDGITFLGGRWIEFALVAESGDEEEEPATRREQVGAERLARTAALLDEAARLGVQLDADDEHAVDGSRDLFLERTQLEVGGEIDSRPTAESTYVYRGLRERYGVVRGRDSILPFDLVLQGSFSDLRLGAFPRWRQPEETEDAFLYR